MYGVGIGSLDIQELNGHCMTWPCLCALSCSRILIRNGLKASEGLLSVVAFPLLGELTVTITATTITVCITKPVALITAIIGVR